MLKKLRAALEKCIDFLIKNASTIDEKASPKMRKARFARKFDETLPGAPFGAKDRFLVDFGDPQGTQKSSQRGEHHWGKGSWELPEVLDTNLGVVSETFWGGIRDFLVNSGSIFINFGSFFVV